MLFEVIVIMALLGICFTLPAIMTQNAYARIVFSSLAMIVWMTMPFLMADIETVAVYNTQALSNYTYTLFESQPVVDNVSTTYTPGFAVNHHYTGGALSYFWVALALMMVFNLFYGAYQIYQEDKGAKKRRLYGH